MIYSSEEQEQEAPDDEVEEEEDNIVSDDDLTSNLACNLSIITSPSSGDTGSVLGNGNNETITNDDDFKKESPSPSLVVEDDDDDAVSSSPPPRIIVCDFYGLPKEKRPRKEKVLAIARQIVNFLLWQHQGQVAQQARAEKTKAHHRQPAGGAVLAEIVIVGCNSNNDDDNIGDNAQIALLMNRMKQLWDDNEEQEQNPKPFPPSNVTFSDDSLSAFLLSTAAAAAGAPPSKEGPETTTQRQGREKEEDVDDHGVPKPEGGDDDDGGGDTTTTSSKPADDDNDDGAVYLSPDSSSTLDINTAKPPRIVIVGLIIDRKVQLNRSLNRANALRIRTARWPLEECCFAEETMNNMNEPLNVDCILEGMQQWYWNVDEEKQQRDEIRDEPSSSSYRRCFVDAATQAVRNHRLRHPGRPFHT